MFKTVTPQIYNHGIWLAGVPNYGQMLKDFSNKFPKAILITIPHMAGFMAMKLEEFNIPSFRFDATVPLARRGAVLEEFNETNVGVLITSPMIAGNGGWRATASTIIVADAHINLELGTFDSIVNRAQVEEVHLVNCVFSNLDIERVWKLRNIHTLRSDIMAPFVMTTRGIFPAPEFQV